MRVSPSQLRIQFRPRLLIAYAVLAATIALALLGFVRVLPSLIRVPSQLDFGAYYVAGRMLNAGVSLYRPSPLDNDTLGITGIQHTGYIYPPFFAALLRPLVYLPYRAAESIWFISNIVLFVPLCLLLRYIFALPKRWLVGLLLFGVLLPAVYDTWLLGQMSVLLTTLMLGSLALAIHKSQQPRYNVLAGVLLGFAAAIKVYPILLVGIYLCYRRWYALLGVFVSLFIAFVFGIMFGGGWKTTQYWFTSVLPSASNMVPFPSNQSLRGVIARFFTVNTFQVPVLNKDNYVQVTLQPILDSSTVSTALIITTSVVLLLITAWTLLRRRESLTNDLLTLDFAIGTAVMLLITPVVWDLYYVHLLLPLVLVASFARTKTSFSLILVVVYLLLIVQRYWRYLLLYVQSPWFMLSGFLAVMVLWATLLIIRRQMIT